MKRPSFQFYPADWLTDLKLRRCSLPSRALWMDMLCLMHEGEPYGHLRTAVGDVPTETLAKLVGISFRRAKCALDELESNQVFSRNDAGTIFSRRMVRDEKLRDVRSKCGSESSKNPRVPRKKQNWEEILKDIQEDTPEGYPEGPNVVPSPTARKMEKKNTELLVSTKPGGVQRGYLPGAAKFESFGRFRFECDRLCVSGSDADWGLAAERWKFISMEDEIACLHCLESLPPTSNHSLLRALPQNIIEMQMWQRKPREPPKKNIGQDIGERIARL